MARKSQFNLPNPATGAYELHHLETELSQIEDMGNPGREANAAATAADFRAAIGAVGGFRLASTAYALGAVVYASALSNMQKLVCVQPGTTGSEALVLTSTAEGSITTDGTAVWMVDSFADGDYDAEHQNGIYRGADITAYCNSGIMSTNIQAGKFVGMHIGDFITKSVSTAAKTYTNKAGTSVTQAAATYTDVKWLIGGFDIHYNCGDDDGITTAHHVLLIPSETLQRNVCMNPKVSSKNTTAGGYLGSDMWKIHMPLWSTAIKNAFGSAHVLAHREALSNAVNETAASRAGANWVGTTTGWAWTTVEANIPNEAMVYGGSPFSSSGHDTGSMPRMLPLYALKGRHINDRSWFWTRAVASATRFASAGAYGNAGNYDASTSLAYGGIRPYFLYH